jgi:hypothetical protein
MTGANDVSGQHNIPGFIANHNSDISDLNDPNNSKASLPTSPEKNQAMGIISKALEDTNATLEILTTLLRMIEDPSSSICQAREEFTNSLKSESTTDFSQTEIETEDFSIQIQNKELEINFNEVNITTDGGRTSEEQISITETIHEPEAQNSDPTKNPSTSQTSQTSQPQTSQPQTTSSNINQNINVGTGSDSTSNPTYNELKSISGQLNDIETKLLSSNGLSIAQLLKIISKLKVLENKLEQLQEQALSQLDAKQNETILTGIKDISKEVHDDLDNADKWLNKADKEQAKIDALKKEGKSVQHDYDRDHAEAKEEGGFISFFTGAGRAADADKAVGAELRKEGNADQQIKNQDENIAVGFMEDAQSAMGAENTLLQVMDGGKEHKDLSAAVQEIDKLIALLTRVLLGATGQSISAVKGDSSSVLNTQIVLTSNDINEIKSDIRDTQSDITDAEKEVKAINSLKQENEDENCLFGGSSTHNLQSGKSIVEWAEIAMYTGTDQSGEHNEALAELNMYTLDTPHLMMDVQDQFSNWMISETTSEKATEALSNAADNLTNTQNLYTAILQQLE